MPSVWLTVALFACTGSTEGDSGLSGSASATGLDDTDGSCEGPYPWQYLEQHVSAAGDLNQDGQVAGLGDLDGDGLDDFGVGAPGLSDSSGEYYGGGLEVFSGSGL